MGRARVGTSTRDGTPRRASAASATHAVVLIPAVGSCRALPKRDRQPYGLAMGWSCARCAGANPEGTRFCGHCGTPVAVTLAEERAAELAPVGDERREVTSLFADISG